MTLRARLVVVVGVVAAALAGGGGALACTNIHFGVMTPNVGRGGTIHFTISNLVTGASWTVGVEGGGSLSGVAAQDGAVSGDLTMPDLGSSSRTVRIGGTVAHDDIENSPWPLSGEVTYDPPPPPAAEQPAPAPTPTPTPEPVAAPAQPVAAQPPTPEPQPAPAPVAAAAPAATPVPVAQPAHRRTVRPVATRAAVSPSHARPAARSVQRPGRVATSRPARHTIPHARRAQPRAHPPPHRVGHAPRARRAARTLRPDLPTIRAVPVPRHVVTAPRRSFAWLPLALGALLLLAGCGGGAFVVVRRRPRGPTPDEIEAELQELIAEERTKTLERR